MNVQEIDLLLPQVAIDEIIEAAHKFADAWNTLPEEEKKEEPPPGYSNE